ncbi:MAG TPA: TIGR00153 family protein [Bacteroidetes bacterium]|nr:TIGR00153 family protein [Bacteroidota bacterium]
MSILESLFSRSPFSPLQSHMEKVCECVQQVERLYAAFVGKDYSGIQKIADEISELEHAADLLKNEIRGQLPQGLFLAVNRGDLLEILSLQDSIADTAEDLGVLMGLKKLEPIEEMEEELKAFMDKNIEAVTSARAIIRQMDELLQTSFGGKEAKKVTLMIDDVAYMEHEADIMQRKLLKKLYNLDDKLSYSEFSLWINILKSVAAFGNLSEKLANRVRMLLDNK